MTIQTQDILRYPIGVSDFEKLIIENYLFVDKSLLIKELMEDGAQVLLMARPRRFGKTINMSMLYYFFALQQGKDSKRHLFDNTMLAQQHTEVIDEHQGKYPTILISLKDIKTDEYETAINELGLLIQELFQNHEYLLESEALSRSEKQYVEKVINGTSDVSKLKFSLKYLTKYLSKHHNERVIVLIDEYDTIIQQAYLHNYYDEMIEFMRPFLSSALKDNPFLKKAVLTGILRVAKESIFSGLNNVRVQTIFDERYSEFFGFTQEEINGLLEKIDKPELQTNLKKWYNGYQFGSNTLYNPWSIVNCLQDNGQYQSYWVNTSSSDLIAKLVTKSNPSLKADFENLLRGDVIEKLVDQHTSFKNLGRVDSAVWHLLLCSGYLTAALVDYESTSVNCRIRLPNREIKDVFDKIVKDWFASAIGVDKYHDMLSELVVGNVDVFFAILQEFIIKSASYHDFGGDTSEQYYHVFVLGVLVSLQFNFEVLSNRESGYGRYDLAIIPNNDINDTAILFEFKASKNDNDDLKAMAQAALSQIDQKKYTTNLARKNITKVVKIGLAFKTKEVEMAYQREDAL